MHIGDALQPPTRRLTQSTLRPASRSEESAGRLGRTFERMPHEFQRAFQRIATDRAAEADADGFALEGMSLYGRMTGVSDGKMLFEPNLKANLDNADRVYNGINALIDRHIAEKGIEAADGSPYVPLWEPDAEPGELDLEAEGVTCVIWATGFTPDWSYVGLPIFDGTGYPVQQRGVTGIDGVYILGLPWLWTWGSGRFLAVGRDAEYVVGHLASHLDLVDSPLKQAASG